MNWQKQTNETKVSTNSIMYQLKVDVDKLNAVKVVMN